MPLHRADLKRQEIRGFHTCFPSKTGIGQPLRPSAEIGRQARLRAVCFRTCGFESHLGHVFISYVGESWKAFHLSATRPGGEIGRHAVFRRLCFGVRVRVSPWAPHHSRPGSPPGLFLCPQFLQSTGARVYAINTLPIKALAFMGFEEIYLNAALLTCRSLATNTPMTSHRLRRAIPLSPTHPILALAFRRHAWHPVILGPSLHRYEQA